MQSISLEQLRNLLQQTPMMVQMHPLSLAFLTDEVQVFAAAEELVAALDAPDPQPEVPTVALTFDERFAHRLPSVRCDHDPFTTELNRFLLPKIDWVQRWVLCQSQIPKVICQRASGDCIVLILVDGLSFYDWKRFARESEAPPELFTFEPCFVDGVSITEHGMRRIVGEPTVALQLTELGYRRSFGFSYWERTDNELTDRLFAGITEGVHRVKSFDEVLEQLPKLPLDGSFVQIVRQGLDQVGHRYRDRPNIAATVRQIFDELRQLQRCLAEKELTATIFLTADHGILWSHEHDLKLYEAGVSHVPPRYYEGLRSGEGIWRVQFEGNDFSVLTYPFVRRKLRSDEWGVHGGLSFEESLVSFVTAQVTSSEL